MSEDYRSFEDDYYDEILHEYSDESKSSIESEIWKNKNLINLMRTLKLSNSEKNSEEFWSVAKNSIILMLALFDNLPVNSFNRKGQNTKQISNEDREDLKEILLKIT